MEIEKPQRTFSQHVLAFAGVISFALAIFQAMVCFSPSWSRYFGAPEELVSNIPLLIVAGLIATVIFAVFGLYAISGAGIIGRLPLLRWALLAIACVFILRGLLVVPQIIGVNGVEPIPPQAIISSLVALGIGIVYLIGVIGNWARMKA